MSELGELCGTNELGGLDELSGLGGMDGLSDVEKMHYKDGLVRLVNESNEPSKLETPSRVDRSS